MSENNAIIKCEDIWFRYEEDAKWILKGINLEIKKGEFVAVVGQNGAGKTTLVKHLNGILQPSKGTVYINDRDVSTIPFQEIASLVGYSYQNPDHQIFNLTVQDEIKFGPLHVGIDEEIINKRVEEVLRTVGLDGLEEEYPFSLGRGQRQKLAVASILAMNPKVIIIDEPTTGLDWTGGVAMMELIQKLHQEGETIIMITHDMRIVSDFAERMIVMAQGEVLLDGPPRTVFSNSEVLKKAFLAPPQITRIAQMLAEYGVSPDLLSVDEVVSAIKKELEN